MTDPDLIAAYDAAWARVHTLYSKWTDAQYNFAPYTSGEPAPLRDEQIAVEDECAAAWADYIAARDAVFGVT